MVLPLLLLLFASPATANSTMWEVTPAGCDCRDWYGGCRSNGEKWTDDETWNYECKGTDGCKTSTRGGKNEVRVGGNDTINNFWYSCEANELRLKYAQEPRCDVNGSLHHVGEEFREGTFHWLCLETGRWIVGCYYKNETEDWVRLKLGETAFNGLVKHVCDRYVDYPGRTQYYAEVRDDVHVKHPNNKGGPNKNLPEAGQFLLKEKPVRWLHENAASFVVNDQGENARIRYLPASRRAWN